MPKHKYKELPDRDSDPDAWADAVEKKLRAYAMRIFALVDEVAELRAGAAPVSAPSDTPDPGTFVPRATCLVCGGHKGEGRSELTCRPCGAERNKIIKTKGAERPSYTDCKNCGVRKTGSMRLLCDPCSKAFAQWKTT